MFEFCIGCEEWSENTEFETQGEAVSYGDGWEERRFTMGLYPATFCWFKNKATGEKTIIETGHQPETEE